MALGPTADTLSNLIGPSTSFIWVLCTDQKGLLCCSLLFPAQWELLLTLSYLIVF